MKKQIPMALTVAGAIIAFCGCAELQLGTLEYKRLNQNSAEQSLAVVQQLRYWSDSSYTRLVIHADQGLRTYIRAINPTTFQESPLLGLSLDEPNLRASYD